MQKKKFSFSSHSDDGICWEGATKNFSFQWGFGSESAHLFAQVFLGFPLRKFGVLRMAKLPYVM